MMGSDTNESKRENNKQKNSDRKKKTKSDKYGRISPLLIPGAALATALPQSPSQLDLSRPPSPLTSAIASFTKVGQSIIGNLSQERDISKNIRRNSSLHSEKDSKEEEIIYQEPWDSIRNKMANRPPIPVPKNVKSTESVYATVDKSNSKMKLLSNEIRTGSSRSAQGSSSKHQKSSGEYSPKNVNNNSPSSVNNQNKVLTKKSVSEPNLTRHPPQLLNLNILKKSKSEEVKLSKQKKISPSSKKAVKKEKIKEKKIKMASINELESYENNVNVDVEEDNELVSEGQVNYIPNTSLAHSNEQLIYLSKENLSLGSINDTSRGGKDAYSEMNSADELDGMLSSDELQLNSSYNSSFSASNFITSERLEQRASRQYTDHHRHSANPRLNSYQPSDEFHRNNTPQIQQQQTQQQGYRSLQNNKSANVNLTPDAYQRNQESPYQATSVDNESRLNPENYLHMSATRRNSANSSNYTYQTRHLLNHNERKLRDTVNERITELLQIMSVLNTSDHRMNVRDDWKISALNKMIEDNNNNEHISASPVIPEENEVDVENHHSFHQTLQQLKKENHELRLANVALKNEKSRHNANKTVKIGEGSLNKQRTESLITSPPYASKQTVPYHDWCKLKAQAQLVVDENQFLLEQKLLYKQNVEELNYDYQQEIKDLTMKLKDSMKEKNMLTQQLLQCQLKLSQLSTKYDVIIEDMGNRVEKSLYEKEIDDLSISHKDKLSKVRKENDDLKVQIKVSLKEREKLAIKLTNVTVERNQLLTEVQTADKYIRKYEKRLAQSSTKLLNKSNKENVAKFTLDKVIKVAEKNIVEREDLVHELHKQKYKTDLAVTHLLHEDKKIENLKHKVKKSKDSNKEKVMEMQQRLVTREKDMESIKEVYLSELHELRKLVKEKQQFIDEVQTNGELTSSDINNIYKILKS